MGGVDVGGPKGKRKSLDSEINMIPMIDLLMVTISFLLITAVWTQMARINADAQTPGKREDTPPEEVQKERQLHIEVKAEGFRLIWKEGATVVGEGATDVPRNERVIGGGMVQFPALEQKISEQYDAYATKDKVKKDQAILHTDDKLEYRFIIGVIDAIYAKKRAFEGAREMAPAFNVTFSPSAVSN